MTQTQAPRRALLAAAFVLTLASGGAGTAAVAAAAAPQPPYPPLPSAQLPYALRLDGAGSAPSR